jgi:magnesium transporter
MMRPRRESGLGRNFFMGYKGGNSPKGGGQPTSFRREHANSTISNGPLRRQATLSKTYDSTGEETDEDEAPHDKTPLISSSMRNGRPSDQVTGGGIFGATRVSSNNRRDSASSHSSKKRKRRPSRETSFLRHEHTDYDVNNPPSVPPSPTTGMGAEMDDVMFAGADFAIPRSPPARREPSSYGNDTIIDVDSKPRSLPENGPEAHDASVQRSKTIALPVEEDVCFPTSGMSEMAEEEYISQGQGEPDTSGSRRRRRRMWPDLAVLGEWSISERITLHQETRAKKISEPVLVGGRLRPSGQGWHRTEEDSPYRYTYFNEEFESTIHAQTISELVQPGSSFKELFIPDPPELEDESSSDEENVPSTTGGNGEKISLSPSAQEQSEKTSEKRPPSLISDLKPTSRDTSGQQSGQVTPQRNNFSKTSKPKRYGSRPTFWLDVLCPTNDEMRVLAKAFAIHGLTAEDIMMQETREKVELFRNYYFINYRTFEQDQEDADYLEPINIYIVVFRDGVLSFHFSQTPHPANVRRRVRQLKDYLILSADWISYAIIDDITDVFQPLIQSIEEEVDYIDEKILQLHSDTIGSSSIAKSIKNEKRSDAGPEENSPGIDMLRQVGDCRKKVMGLYRLLGNKADVIKGFAKRCTEQWDVAPKSEIGLYLGDIQDHILTMTSNLNHYETLLSRAHSNYLAQITIRMNERQEQSADILGKLTVLGTIVLPMNIICGMWGMNVRVPGQDVDSLTWFWSSKSFRPAFLHRVEINDVRDH